MLCTRLGLVLQNFNTYSEQIGVEHSSTVLQQYSSVGIRVYFLLILKFGLTATTDILQIRNRQK